jgi:hypothetical protein
MRLDPLCVVYVQPAPKSRLAVFGLFAYEDREQKQIKSKSRSRAKADQEQKQIKSKSRSRAKADQGLPG